ncbi:MAG TPA: UDP-N-acetylmuramoylalanyl-D-glutamate--2,6-diaminopimelate ligase, partial [Treponema sp.]|nr:UDP-N-acetylmuramoylalanyl-D-glutamate--2,6-diaminopimelate ligase [Treponema sp.]
MNENDSLLSLEEILEAVNGVHVLGNAPLCIKSVQTDSRLVEENTLFVPLIGEKQDGHSYIPQAIEKGASAVFIRMKNFEDNGNYFVELHEKNPSVIFIAVENTLEALQKAAARYVEKFPHLIKIGVTGSSGKTTTKEILVSILSQKYNVVSNKGNLNSETGLPLSVFNIRTEHECGVFEMGMNRENEIGEIASVLKPRFAIVTNIGTAHIGILGSRENIAKEKSKIFSYFGGFGTGVIPSDDDFSDFLKNEIDGKVVFYGNDTDSVKYICDLGLKGTKFSIDGIETVLPLPGKYNY